MYVYVDCKVGTVEMQPYLEGTMSRRDSRNDVNSDMEWLAGLEQPTLEDDDAPGEVESATDKDAVPDSSANRGRESGPWDDGLLELRRRAQDYKNPPPIRQNNPRTGLSSRLRRFWR